MSFKSGVISTFYVIYKSFLEFLIYLYINTIIKIQNNMLETELIKLGLFLSIVGFVTLIVYIKN